MTDPEQLEDLERRWKEGEFEQREDWGDHSIKSCDGAVRWLLDHIAHLRQQQTILEAERDNAVSFLGGRVKEEYDRNEVLEAKLSTLRQPQAETKPSDISFSVKALDAAALWTPDKILAFADTIERDPHYAICEAQYLRGIANRYLAFMAQQAETQQQMTAAVERYNLEYAANEAAVTRIHRLEAVFTVCQQQLAACSAEREPE